MENDTDYFRRRALEERRAAMKSAHRGVRDCHLELANAYEYRVRVMASEDIPPEVQLVRAV